jgi:hypothetical protein
MLKTIVYVLMIFTVIAEQTFLFDYPVCLTKSPNKFLYYYVCELP